MARGINRRGRRREQEFLRFTNAIPYGPGPLPLTGSFAVTEPAGSTILLRVAGSGFSAEPGLRSIEVRVDNTLLGTLDHFFNQANVHEVFVPRTFSLQGLAPGLHTITLTAGPGLLTDANDRFQATVEQSPSTI